MVVVMMTMFMMIMSMMSMISMMSISKEKEEEEEEEEEEGVQMQLNQRPTTEYDMQVSRWNRVRFRNFSGLRNLACATLWSDCATWLAKLRLRNSQLCLCNSQDCATLPAQLSGFRNSACATLRIAQLCYWSLHTLR